MYVFDSMEDILVRSNVTCKPSKYDLELASRVSSLWARFAREGQPEKGWFRFTASQELALKIDLATVSALRCEAGYRQGQCDVMDVVVGKDLALFQQPFF